MKVYRLTREKYASSLSGIGAAIKGARWNPPGIELIYTAENRSLAMAEVAVHLTMATLPEDYMMVTIEIPDGLEIKLLAEVDLPPDWKEFPHPISTQAIGRDFVLEGKYCALKIPSAVTKGDFNILLSPNHKEFGEVAIVEMEKFPFDRRIFR